MLSPNDISTPFDSYPLQYAKRLSNIIARLAAAMYTYIVESLAGQCEYTTQPKGSFWCHVIDTKGAILLVILLNKFALVLFHSNLGMW